MRFHSSYTEKLRSVIIRRLEPSESERTHPIADRILSRSECIKKGKKGKAIDSGNTYIKRIRISKERSGENNDGACECTRETREIFILRLIGTFSSHAAFELRTRSNKTN